ncbi:MAG: Uma2 family endonuclease [Caldilineaceae bacterium]
MSVQSVVQSALGSPSGELGWPQQRQWTYIDYLRLPNDGNRYEIIAGVLYVANAPSVEHQFTVLKLTFYFELHSTNNQLDMVLTAPLEVHLTENTKPVQPDVLFMRRDRQPSIGAQVIKGAPDLVVAVISPSSLRLDRTVKFDAYERAGVPEYWIVDPKARLVEVYTLARGEYALLGQYTGDEVVTSNVLVGLAVRASLLFLPTAGTG